MWRSETRSTLLSKSHESVATGDADLPCDRRSRREAWERVTESDRGQTPV